MSRPAAAPGGVTGEQPGRLVPAAHRPQPRRSLAAAVRPHGHVRREDLHQCGDVPAERRLDEALGRLAADTGMGPVERAAGVHVLPRPVRELAHRRRTAVDDLRDLGVRVAEHLVEDEDRPLQRGERLEDHQHRQRHRLGAQGAVGRVVGARFVEQRLRQPGPHIRLAAPGDRGAARERVVHGDPYEVGAWVGDRVQRCPPGTARPGQPGLLEDVLGVGDAAEDVVDDREEQLAMVDEHLCGALGPLGHAIPPWVRSPLRAPERVECDIRRPKSDVRLTASRAPGAVPS